MAGLCITAVTLIAAVAKTSAGTIVDEILVLCSVLFLLCTYSVFWALRTKGSQFAGWLERLAATVFAIALTGIVSAGLLMVFRLG